MKTFNEFLSTIKFTNPALVENIQEAYSLLFESNATQQAIEQANQVVQQTTEEYKQLHGIVDEEPIDFGMGGDDLFGDGAGFDLPDEESDEELTIDQMIDNLDFDDTLDDGELSDDLDTLADDTTEETDGNEIDTDGTTEEEPEDLQPEEDDEQEAGGEPPADEKAKSATKNQ